MAATSVLSGLLKGATWDEVTDYLSPAVLDIVSPRELSKELMQLSGNFLRKGRWRARRSKLAEGLSGHFGGLELHDNLGGHATQVGSLDLEARRARGNRLLELYFYQIEHQGAALLDLRSASFTGEDTLTRWAPAPLYCEWSPTFIDGVRKLYRGFYGNTPGVYEEALETLSLKAADSVFRQHFGSGDQRSVTFSLSHFRSTFHETFLICKREGVRLSAEFVSLGLMLACLYEHLEKLNADFDVRAAYANATSGAR